MLVAVGVSRLPLVALGVGGLAATLTRLVAGALRDTARQLLDVEVRAGLRQRVDLVGRLRRGAGRLHLALTRADVQAGVGQLSRAAVRVVTRVVRRARLDLRNQVAGVRLRLRVLALLLLAEEGRQGDRGKNADDQDHNEKLDEREALLLAVDPLGKLPQHGHSSLEPVVWPDTSAAPSLVAARPTPAG